MLKDLLRQILGRERPHPRAARPAEESALIAAGDQALREGCHREAADRYLAAAALGSGNAELHSNLATALKALGRAGEALAHYRVAVELKPELAEAWYNLGLLYAESGELDAAEACYREALLRRPEFRAAHSSLLCLTNFHEGYEPGRILAEHRAWDARHGVLLASLPPHGNERSPQRQLRIGYVSADLREHAMACFVEPILDRHDRSAFTVILYSNATREDETSLRLRGHAREWRRIAGLADAEAADLVRRDAIDILIDLSGHTEGNRLGIFALKPAPVQVSCLGYPNTTGMAAMDYRITDARADPPGESDRFYCERLLRMPDSLWCYSPPADLPEVGEPPARANGHATFGSFNNVMKLSGSAIATWARLLLSVPGARLLVAAAGGEVAQRRLRRQFDAGGVDPGRLEIIGRLPAREFRRLYARVDIALDPFPCNGGTTTCETMWMGVPVVTLAGGGFPGRAGSSILAPAGLEDLIAPNETRYVEAAAALAADTARLERLRRSMRERLRASPLMDARRYVRALESHYREAWRGWCGRD